MAKRGESQKPSYDATLKAVGKKLAELRLKKGYSSQLQFAADHGLSHIQYWRMENGSANLTFKSLDRVLAIHNMTIEKLFMSLAKKKSSRVLVR